MLFRSIEGKFKSFHNASDNVAQQMAKTFFALLNLADLSGKPSQTTATPPDVPLVENIENPAIITGNQSGASLAGFHYNIQIHLPATKDVEVYNSIFKSLKEHFVD